MCQNNAKVNERLFKKLGHVFLLFCSSYILRRGVISADISFKNRLEESFRSFR